MKQQLFGGKVGIQTQGSVALREPGLLLTSQGGAQGTSWVGREALPGLHGAGHSDTALSSREGGTPPPPPPPPPLSPLPFVKKQQGHSLLLHSHPSHLCPWRLGERVPWLMPGENKDGGQSCPRQGRRWLWGRKGELRVK